MALVYDFDIRTEKDGKLTAHFREPATVAAIKGADPVVRAYFEAAGFTMTTHESGAGSGRYPAGDEAGRITVIERLGDSLWHHDISGAEMNGFDFGAFMAHLSEAEPVEIRHAAFSLGLPVERLTSMFRRARPTRVLTRPLKG